MIDFRFARFSARIESHLRAPFSGPARHFTWNRAGGSGRLSSFSSFSSGFTSADPAAGTSDVPATTSILTSDVPDAGASDFPGTSILASDVAAAGASAAAAASAAASASAAFFHPGYSPESFFGTLSSSSGDAGGGRAAGASDAFASAAGASDFGSDDGGEIAFCGGCAPLSAMSETTASKKCPSSSFSHSAKTRVPMRRNSSSSSIGTDRWRRRAASTQKASSLSPSSVCTLALEPLSWTSWQSYHAPSFPCTSRCAPSSSTCSSSPSSSEDDSERTESASEASSSSSESASSPEDDASLELSSVSR
mmetsp:Transcript_30860/g.73326  ORF Transcript_30860/g.73326 Transcript_30860/m.73326 type:complete len:308 (-) Transcript_30860:616-1539(-)